VTHANTYTQTNTQNPASRPASGHRCGLAEEAKGKRSALLTQPTQPKQYIDEFSGTVECSFAATAVGRMAMGGVVALRDKKTAGGKAAKSDEQWRRRQALLLVAQLPEDEGEALAVLERAVGIVKKISSAATLV
jgi:hypothetical protein